MAEGAISTFPDNVSPLQMFWSMPRRIRVDFAETPESFLCSLTGTRQDVAASAFRRRPNGIKYENFTHPLSPYRRSSANEAFRAFRAPKDNVGYRHWVGLVVPSHENEAECLVRPARSVVLGIDRLRSMNASARLHAFGYATEKNKALAFVESEMPLYGVRVAHRREYGNIVRRMVEGAGKVRDLLNYGLRSALFVKRTQVQDGFQKAPKEGGALDLARSRFWDRTEKAFGTALADVALKLDRDDADVVLVAVEVSERWLAILQAIARDLFDELVPFDDLDALDIRSARARIEARNDLHLALRGYGKIGAEIHKALGLNPPANAKKGCEEGGARMTQVTAPPSGGSDATDRSRSDKSPRRDRAHRWWQRLQPRNDDDSPNPNADRGSLARLRRASTPTDILDEEAVFALHRSLGYGRSDTFVPAAVAAAVLAHVRAHVPGRTPARAVGRTSFADRDLESAAMSPFRLRRLLQAREPDDVLRQMRRLVEIADRKLDVGALATLILDWFDERRADRVRTLFAFDYYDARGELPEARPNPSSSDPTI